MCRSTVLTDACELGYVEADEALDLMVDGTYGSHTGVSCSWHMGDLEEITVEA